MKTFTKCVTNSYINFARGDFMFARERGKKTLWGIFKFAWKLQPSHFFLFDAFVIVFLASFFFLGWIHFFFFLNCKSIQYSWREKKSWIKLHASSFDHNTCLQKSGLVIPGDWVLYWYTPYIYAFVPIYSFLY